MVRVMSDSSVKENAAAAAGLLAWCAGKGLGATSGVGTREVRYGDMDV